MRNRGSGWGGVGRGSHGQRGREPGFAFAASDNTAGAQRAAGQGASTLDCDLGRGVLSPPSVPSFSEPLSIRPQPRHAGIALGTPTPRGLRSWTDAARLDLLAGEMHRTSGGHPGPGNRVRPVSLVLQKWGNEQALRAPHFWKQVHTSPTAWTFWYIPGLSAAL